MQLAPNLKYTLLMIDILNGKTVPLDKAQVSQTEGKKEPAKEYIHGSSVYFLFVL